MDQLRPQEQHLHCHPIRSSISTARGPIYARNGVLPTESIYTVLQSADIVHSEMWQIKQ